MTDAVVVYYGCQFYSSCNYLVLIKVMVVGKGLCSSVRISYINIHTLLYCTIYRCIVIHTKVAIYQYTQIAYHYISIMNINNILSDG